MSTAVQPTTTTPPAAQPSAAPPVALPPSNTVIPGGQNVLDRLVSKVASQTGVTDPPPPAVPPVAPPSAPPSAPTVVSPPAPDAAVETATADATGAPTGTDTGTEADTVVPEGAATDTAAAPVGELVLADDEHGAVTLKAERNADGTFKTKIDPTQKFDLEFTDKATGERKVYTKTMPEVLRLARDGVALQPIVQEYRTQALPELEQFRKQLPVWEREFSQMEQALADQRALNTVLLTGDEATVAQHRANFQSENSPEKRLARLEAERAAEREQAARRADRQRVAREAVAFMQDRIAPIVSAAVAELGEEVVAGKMALGTLPLQVNGTVPRANWPKLEAYVKGPFADWVQAERAKLATATAGAASRDAASAEVARAQKAAQAAVNDASRALAPVGRAAPDRPPTAPKSTNKDDVMKRLIHGRPLPPSLAGT